MTTRNKVLLGLGVFGFCFLLWISTPWINQQFNPPKMDDNRTPDLAHVGDMFGSVNALFTGLALAAVAVQLWFQREELELQRTELRQNTEELKNQARQLEDQAKTLKIQALVHVMNAQIEHYRTEREVFKTESANALKSSENPQRADWLSSIAKVEILLSTVEKERDAAKESLSPTDSEWTKKRALILELAAINLDGMIACNEAIKKIKTELDELKNSLKPSL